MSAALLLLLAQQPPIAVTNTAPPRIVAVPADPGTPTFVVPGPPFPPAPPPVPPAQLIRGPQARTPLQQLVRPDDYPMSAIAQRQAGRVAFTLDVGANGRVVGCAITTSSGSTALDSTTCRIMRARGRFTPAIDSRGMPAPARVTEEVEWRLPQAGAERG